MSTISDNRTDDVFTHLEERARLQEMYRRVFDSPEGQEVLRHLARVAGVATSTFVPGQPDVMAFREGQRHLVLSIIRFVGRDDLVIIAETMRMRQHANTESTVG
jgi:hypothetical protein